MRLSARTHSPVPGATTADDVLQLGPSSMPTKAERLLGTRNRLGRSRSTRLTPDKSSKSPSFDLLKHDEQKSLGSLLRTQPGLQNSMSNHGGSRNWHTSNSHRPKEQGSRSRLSSFFSRKDSSTTNTTNSSLRHERSDSTLRSYYDAARQPLHVSQQTSASAVRDMGLRKGAPVLDGSSAPGQGAQRPLKSAMKHHNSGRQQNPSVDGRKPKKLDLSKLFPQPNGQSKQHVLSPTKLTQSPSTMTNVSDGFPPDTIHARLRRPSANARFELEKIMSPSSSDSTSTYREKVFERDIFDNAKTHVRRPPKGIKNWFDGFDISSDEEEKLVEMVHELPATEVVTEALPSTFSPYGEVAMESFPHHDTAYGHRDRKVRMNPAVKKRTRAVDDRRGSEDSIAVESFVSSQPSRRKGESRLATSRLQDESVLSLSSSSEDEESEVPNVRDSLADQSDTGASDFVVRDAATVGVSRPAVPPRELLTRRSTYGRESTATLQTTASIPIAVSPDVSMADTKLSRAPSGSTTRTEHRNATSRKLRGIHESHVSPQPKETPLQTTTVEYEGSAAGETNGSVPSETSRLMAVTDEEMVLLEMMRRKRAMMAKNSFTEGYRLALKQEQEALVLRRQSAHRSALQILREKGGRPKSRDSSVGSQPPSEDVDNLRRLSMLRQEGVDRAHKLQRFLATETPLDEIFPSPPMSHNKGSSPSGEEGERLLPRTFDPRKVLQQRHSKIELTTWMPPLDDRAASKGVTSDTFMDKFLASGSTSSREFPTPPRSMPQTLERQVSKRSSRLSPSLDNMPQVISRSSSRQLLVEDVNPRHTSSRQHNHKPATSDPLLDTALAVPTTTNDSRSGRLSPASRAGTHSLLNSPFTHQDENASTSGTSLHSQRAPSFALPLTPEKLRSIDMVDSGSDVASSKRAYTPELESALTAVPAPLRKKLGSSSSGTKRKQQPPAIETMLQHQRSSGLTRMGSIGSVTSASDDVLAAWAELGGGNDGFATSLPRKTRAR